jgi:tetratricopeptide (TPR) repeat protein
MKLPIKFILITVIAFTGTITTNCQTADDYVASGTAKCSAKDYDGALVDFNKAIELKPDDAEVYAVAYQMRGFVEQVKGEYDSALADYNKAIKLKPDWAQPYFNRGFIEEARKNLDGALTDFTKAIQLKPDYSDAYAARGIVREWKGDLAGALADFSKAFQLNPGDGKLLQKKEEVRRRMGK